MRIGAIEAGGTKFICGIGDENGEIEHKVSFPTTTPKETMTNVINYFKLYNIEAMGIGSFGPINLDKSSSQYGYITTTPKPGWANFDFLGTLKEVFNVPYGWDTDLNAATLGEVTWGAAKGMDSCVYFTIGTGVGLGVYAEGKLIHGLIHPEGGHIYVRRHQEDHYEGHCPYHKDCLEGLTAGPAIEKRWGAKSWQLPREHPAWEIEAYYLSQAIMNTILLISPRKIILGGGVMKQSQLFPMIRKEVQCGLNDYLSANLIQNQIDDYIVPPGLGDNAGLCGALALGSSAKSSF